MQAAELALFYMYAEAKEDAYKRFYNEKLTVILQQNAHKNKYLMCRKIIILFKLTVYIILYGKITEKGL